jgi:hypothetical protein
MGQAYTAIEPVDTRFPEPVVWPDDINWDGWPEGWNLSWPYPGGAAMDITEPIVNSPGIEPPGYRSVYRLDIEVDDVAVHNGTTGKSDALTIQGSYMDGDYPGYSVNGYTAVLTASDTNGNAYTFSVDGEEKTSHSVEVGINREALSANYGYVEFSVDVEYIDVGVGQIDNRGWLVSWRIQLQRGGAIVTDFSDANKVVTRELTYTADWSETVAKPSILLSYAVAEISPPFDISITEMKDYDNLYGAWLAGQTVSIIATDELGTVLGSFLRVVDFIEGEKCEVLFADIVLDITNFHTSSVEDADLDLGSGDVTFTWTLVSDETAWTIPSGSFVISMEEVLDPPDFNWQTLYITGTNVYATGDSELETCAGPEVAIAYIGGPYVFDRDFAGYVEKQLFLYSEGGDCNIVPRGPLWRSTFVSAALAGSTGDISSKHPYSTARMDIDWEYVFNSGTNRFTPYFSHFAEDVEDNGSLSSRTAFPAHNYSIDCPIEQPKKAISSARISYNEATGGSDKTSVTFPVWAYFNVRYISGYTPELEPIYAYKDWYSPGHP